MVAAKDRQPLNRGDYISRLDTCIEPDEVAHDLHCFALQSL